MENGEERKGLENGNTRGRQKHERKTYRITSSSLKSINLLKDSLLWWLKTDSGADYLGLNPGSVIYMLCDCVSISSS